MTRLPSEKPELFNGSRTSHQAVAKLKVEGALPAQTIVQAGKYLNNIIEQDHRMVKQRCYLMLGFKTFVDKGLEKTIHLLHFKSDPE